MIISGTIAPAASAATPVANAAPTSASQPQAAVAAATVGRPAPQDVLSLSNAAHQIVQGGGDKDGDAATVTDPSSGTSPSSASGSQRRDRKPRAVIGFFPQPDTLSGLNDLRAPACRERWNKGFGPSWR